MDHSLTVSLTKLYFPFVLRFFLERHFAITVPPTTQDYKMVTVELL